MKGIMFFLSFITFLLVSVSLANGQDVQYLGKIADREAGIVRLSGQDYEVSEGSEIPGVGTVKQITDTHLILRQALSEQEKEELVVQGAAVYDVLEIHIPLQNLRVVTVP